MRTFWRYTTTVILGVLCMAGSAQAAASSEIHITPSGVFTAKNMVVMQTSGAALYGRVTWGNAYVRLTVLASQSTPGTVIIKNNGGAASFSDIQVGDIISVEGSLSASADTLLINASKIQDASLNKEPKVLAGTVKSIDYSGSFVLPDKKLGNVKVVVDGNTVITKGIRSIALGEVSVGDRVSALTGTYDYETKTLSADSFTVFQNQAMFNPQNFSGTLKSLSGTELPVTMVVTVGKTDYTVYVPAASTIMSKSRAATSLQRFTLGDSVRLYGAIRQTNPLEIDSSIIRNLAF